jgi:REP-associated tyrosine transposase
MKPTETLRKPILKLHSYRVRLQGLARAIDTNLIFEKIIDCFAHHQANLYDHPDFVVCDAARFADKLDLFVEAASKPLLLERIAKLGIGLKFKSVRCRPFDFKRCARSRGFAAWLIKTYGLDGAHTGRRRVRAAQRRPIGNNYTYHVWNRTAHRRLLFGPCEKKMIVEIATQICRDKKVQLHVYEVMGNHFHLVLTTQNDVSISDLMQRIDWEISTWYNRLHNTSGALWEGPFKHKVCEPTVANLLRLINYVHANALRAGLVSDAEQYAWSSYRHYSGSERSSSLVVPLCVRRLRPNRKERQAWYASQFEQQYRCGKLQHDPLMTTGSAIVGSRQFQKVVKDTLSDVTRLPAFLRGALKLKSEGVVWGLKTLLHLLCRPAIDAWMTANNSWKEMTERIDRLVPVPEPPG